MDAATIQTLVTIGSFLVMGTAYIVNGRMGVKALSGRLDSLDKAIGDFKEEIKKLQEVIVAQALHGARIQTIDDRSLEQGKRMNEMGARILVLERGSHRGLA